MGNSRAKFKRLADTEIRWNGSEEVKQLFSATERLNGGDPEADTEVSHWLGVVQHDPKAQELKGNSVDDANALIEYATALRSQSEQVRKAIADVESSLGALRRSIVSRS